MSISQSMIAILILSFFQISIAEAASRNQRIKRTQVRQAKRIRNGVQNGTLTRGETRQLVRQQRRVNRTRRRAVSDDGRIDNKELAKIRARQARASGNIYRKKHNRRNQNAESEGTTTEE